MEDKFSSSTDSDGCDVDSQVNIKDKKQEDFVRLLSKYKVLFNKSQVPAIKIRKENALLDLNEEYVKIIGKQVTVKQLKKKIQNLKTKEELKKKTDVKATGNKKIFLKDWEKKLFELLEVESNPVFNKVPGSTSVGCGSQIQQTKSMSDADKDIPIKQKRITRLAEETQETQNLSTGELQRLVLLEQLKLIRLQINSELSKMQNSTMVDISNDEDPLETNE